MRSELSSGMTSSSSYSASSFFARFWSSALRSKPLSPAVETSVRTSSGDGLVRRLGLFDLILLGIGASIGAGIFVVTGTVARDAGPGVTISFIIAGASCVLNALCYAELASRFPAVVGGAYMYTYSAFNELTAFLVFAQLMLDYHIGAASIARSLASYVVSVLELIPFLKDNIPSWVGHGEEVLGALSINILAPILLVLLTVVLCWGVGESSILNSIMTVTKVLIVLFVIIVGAFEVDVSNWTPFAPYGLNSILTGATVVFFSYVGFDAVANSAEEAKRPQSRLYLGLGRDGLLPAIFARVHPTRHTPVQSQVWVGLIASILAGLLNVRVLSHILSVGTLTGYSVVSACVVTLRWKDKTSSQASTRRISRRREGIICLFTIACCGFAAGVLFRYGASFVFLILAAVIAIFLLELFIYGKGEDVVACFSMVYSDPPGFSCPGVPIIPSISIFFNIFLFAQLHYEAWVRFVVLSIVTVGVYAFYGQYHADPLGSNASIVYHRAPAEEAP
ncbi:UNVERIFIED_CONTAM: Cationic amino acid transporter 9, chloroplastic [Sesamum radiatum]|uniref:Cationic amino acid transporter 9, chloroplastic n=1 Tax=Sesamum radiatum TaxID=300843 RepID=A0AAW2KQ92_SESRA